MIMCVIHVFIMAIGTVFLATESATFILTGFGVFSCASGLFMFPAIYNYLFPALQVSREKIEKNNLKLIEKRI